MMNKPHSLSLTRTHWRQTTVNEHAYGAEPIHRLVRLAKTGFRSCTSVNPLSTLNNVGLLVVPPHSPCPCYTHVHVRCWHVGTTLVHRTLVNATEHRLIERSVEQTERWLCRWYYLRIMRQ